MFFPLVVHAFDLIVSSVGIYLVRTAGDHECDASSSSRHCFPPPPPPPPLPPLVIVFLLVLSSLFFSSSSSSSSSSTSSSHTEAGDQPLQVMRRAYVVSAGLQHTKEQREQRGREAERRER
eukprot:395699-Hanusia_phi.AAC.1